jgi:hypothetical protein
MNHPLQNLQELGNPKCRLEKFLEMEWEPADDVSAYGPCVFMSFSSYVLLYYTNNPRKAKVISCSFVSFL